ncbi:OB-fold domain-containing protein [Mycolicibacterium palauense]|uniref:OB-fold domain-containing protein n=1 Tax=Mycolicibacterium palauense TaxID=2034511 RepID=UPI001FE31D0A|nr:OB-fold domain-containing protein [Mycolicibacterium palauense]
MDLGWEDVEPAGTVFSWTRTWHPFTREATGHLPYVVLVVELPGADNRRVLGALCGIDDINPRIGQIVRGSIEHPPRDSYWPLLRWRICEQQK